MSDSEKPLEASRSPMVRRSSKDLLNERSLDMRHSLLGSDDGFGYEYDNSSQQSARAPSHERVDDGASCRHTKTGGTGKGTTSKRDGLKSVIFA